MSESEKIFEQELEIFRTEAQVGMQFLYSYLTFNSVVSKSKKALSAVNQTPLFWKTNIGALQSSIFIVLGRIFDQNSPHNIDILLKTAASNLQIFSKKALSARKKRDSSNADEWLPEYLKHIYEPVPDDFRKLKKKIKDYRKIYEDDYRDIRHKVYAHNQVVDSNDMKNLFEKTKISDLQKIFVFLNSLYEALWGMYHNGRKPTLRRPRYAINKIKHNRKPKFQSKSIQEMMVGEVEDFFKCYLGGCQAQIDNSLLKGKHK